MKSQQILKSLNPRLFWDIDFLQLDESSDSAFIIERVFNRGDVEDIRIVRRCYNQELIKKTLLETKHLNYHRLHLASAIIDEPITAFQCYTLRQSNPELFPY